MCMYVYMYVYKAVKSFTYIEYEAVCIFRIRKREANNRTMTILRHEENKKKTLEQESLYLSTVLSALSTWLSSFFFFSSLLQATDCVILRSHYAENCRIFMKIILKINT